MCLSLGGNDSCPRCKTDRPRRVVLLQGFEAADEAAVGNECNGGMECVEIRPTTSHLMHVTLQTARVGAYTVLRDTTGANLER